MRLSEDLQLLEAGEKAAEEIPPAPVIEGRRAAIIEKETPGVAVSFGFPIDLRRGDPGQGQLDRGLGRRACGE